MAVIIPKELYEKLVKCLEQVQDNYIHIERNPNGPDKVYCPHCWEDFGAAGSGECKPDCPSRSYEILPRLKQLYLNQCTHVDETD